mmetsp:Transcript_10702/g.23699  ORF Transcript_10702/g.23699 Transcript_10702/m.23699 type:complete len:233 (-) Transcript_10702:187-885(-)|eukprot:CAMPEP_0172300208 /NCGR_PEP_ID=MMETSP1058-20130122/2339_1 /TAXON_ID=83371 /ORGANISM="Detonula confervacea, Strain CCMP 353" /LENGTH=232 /DNA_ID=CAMNT_0013009911 /DNA_START=93 /DNA_END=791 /DNA_ORIENTATION=-
MSSFAETPGMHLQHLILDSKATATTDQKIACLKTLRIVVKNLADPQKNADPKYRQLKLSNEKVKAKITPCPSALDYMKALGFGVTNEDGEEYLRIESSKAIPISDMEASLAELNAAIEMLVPKETSFSEEKKTPEGFVVRQQSSSLSAASSSASVTGRGMTEKQKARLLMEKKREREAEEAKKARQKTSNLIKQDKFVRENDANWKSKQSAACVKSGNGINTFRDKFGEGDN